MKANKGDCQARLRSDERNTGVFGQQQCVESELRLTAEAHQTHNQRAALSYHLGHKKAKVNNTTPLTSS